MRCPAPVSERARSAASTASTASIAAPNDGSRVLRNTGRPSPRWRPGWSRNTPARAITSASSAGRPARGPVAPKPEIEQWTSPGVGGGQRVRVDPQSRGLPGVEGLEHDVAVAHDAQELVTAVGLCEVDGDAALAPVHEEGDRLGPQRIPARRLDPHHLGAEVGEHHSGQRGRQTPPELHDPNSRTRPRHRRSSPSLGRTRARRMTGESRGRSSWHAPRRRCQK